MKTKSIFLSPCLPWIAIAIALLVIPFSLRSEELQELVAQGRMYEAVLRAHEIPHRIRTPQSELAEARASWALGLQKDASDLFDKVSASHLLSLDAHTEALLAPIIIALQDEHFNEVITRCDQALGQTQSSEVVTQRIHLFKGEALYRTGNFQGAMSELSQSISLGSSRTKGDAYFLLATSAAVLSRYDDMCNYMSQIPIDHPSVGWAARTLAHCAVTANNEVEAQVWLKKSEEEYPEYTSKSFAQLQRLRLAMKANDDDVIIGLLDQSYRLSSSTDHWGLLLQANAESYLATKRGIKQ